VVPVLADELPERVRAREFAVAACTLFHEPDVRRHLPGLNVAVLAEDGARAAYASLCDLPPGARVAVVANDWLHAARIRQSVELLGVHPDQIEMHLHDAPPHAQAVVAASGTAADRHGGAGVISEPAVIASHSLAALRHEIGRPAANPAVHVRSAWV
jgi:hypothetical protein